MSHIHKMLYVQQVQLIYIAQVQLDVIFDACPHLTRKPSNRHIWTLKATVLENSHHDDCQSLLGQFEIWPTVAVEGEAAIAVDRDGEFRYIFLLPPKSITHTIPSVRNIWECNSRGGLSNFLRGTFDLLVSDFNVLAEVHGTVAREDQVHV